MSLKKIVVNNIEVANVDSSVVQDSENLITSGAIIDNIVNNLNDDSTLKSLSAKQGKLLGEKTENIKLKYNPGDDEENIKILDNAGLTIVDISSTFSNFNALKQSGRDVLDVSTYPISKYQQTNLKEDSIVVKNEQDEDVLIIENNKIKINNIDTLADNPILRTKYTIDESESIEVKNNSNSTIMSLDDNGTLKVVDIKRLDGSSFINAMSSFIDYNYCSTALSPFLIKYLNRKTDDFGELTIHLCGDSILGRQDKGSTWNPSNPEISLTPDCNNPQETSYGYQTGHFPPNAWEQLVVYKIETALQYSNAEVKYYNHTAQEVSKTGTWTDLFPVGADCLRLASNSVSGDSVSLTFTDAKYCKFIVSNYAQNTCSATIKIEFSTNGGSTFYVPSHFNLLESQSNTGISGEYSLNGLETIKFAQIRFAGLNENLNYVMRVTHTNSSILRVWGFETWKNKRINVIDCAEGGNVAGSQNSNPKRFYNTNSTPDLVIYELPYLNDLGTGVVQTNMYGGFINTNSTPLQNPSNEYTYICQEDGVYTNFNNIKAYKYDYISYSSTLNSWIYGSSLIDRTVNRYMNDLETSLKTIKRIGIPVLCIVTHDSNGWNTERYFAYIVGNSIMKLLTKKYGFPTIDLNSYQRSLINPNSLTSSPADGTHLNDTGVDVYSSLILSVLNVKENSIGSSNWNNLEFTDSANPGQVVFNIELSCIPVIQILNNDTIVVSNVTTTGFTATGSGSFAYKAYLIK